MHTPHFQRLSTTLVEQNLERVLGEQVTVNRVDVQFFRLGVAVRGLHIWNEVTDDSILSVEELQVPISLFPLGIGQLKLRNPTLTLNIGPDGTLREFRNIPKPQGERRPLRKFPWKSLSIQNATVNLTFPDGDFSLSHFDITPEQNTLSTLTGDLAVQYKDFADSSSFRWEQAKLGPSTIELPNLHVAFNAVQVSGDGTYTLGERFDTQLKVVSPLNGWNALLIGPRTLDGTVTLDIQADGTPEEPKANIAVNAQEFSFEAPSKNGAIVRYALAKVESNIIATKNGIEVLPTPIQIGDTQANLSAVLTPKKGPAPEFKTEWLLTKATVTATGLSLKEALRAGGVAPNPWVDMSTNADINVSGPLKPLNLSGSFVLSGQDFRVGDRSIEDPDVTNTLHLPRARAEGLLSLNEKHILLTVQDVVTGTTQGSGSVDIGFKPEGPLDISVDLSKANLSDFGPLGGAKLRGKGTLKGRIWGPFTTIQMLGHGTFKDFSSTDIDYADQLTATIRSPDMKSILLQRARAVKGETEYGGSIGLFFVPEFSLETDLLISKGRIQDITGMFMDFDGIKGAIEGGEIHLNGPFKDLDGDAELRLVDTELFGERFEKGHAKGQMNKGEFTLSDIRFSRNNGTEGLNLHGTVKRKWALNMNLNADLNLETLSALEQTLYPIEGRITGNLRLDNTLFSPEIHGRLLITEGAYDAQSLEDSQLRLRTQQGVTHINGNVLGEHVRVNAYTNIFDTGTYTADISLSDFPLHLVYPAAADDRPIQATATGVVGLGGILGEANDNLIVNAAVQDLRLQWSTHLLKNNVPITYTQNAAGWMLNDVSIISDHSDKTSIQFRALGDGLQTKVEGKGNIDLDLLRAVVPGLERVEGTGLVRFASTRENGETKTTVRTIIDAPIMRHSGFPGTLEDVRTVIRGDKNAYVIERFTAGLGGGSVSGTAVSNELLHAYLSPTANPSALGVIEADHWMPTRFTLQGEAENVQVQWTDSLAPSVGDASFSFDGPVDQLLLSGSVDITEMNFTDRINWEDWVVEIGDDLLVEAPPVDEKGMFALDIGIRADRTIRLLNNVSDAIASAELRVMGDTSRPGMTGQVRVDEGLVYLQDREFKIERAEIGFRDPWSWDPDLDFDMVTDLDSRRRRYRIHYRVFGPYSNWATQTTSDPWLSQADVNALLWFGVTAEELEEMGELGTAVGQAAVDLFIQDFILADYLGLLGFQETLAGQLLPDVDLVTGANTRGEYSSDPRLKLTVPGLPPRLKAAIEFNLLRADHYGHVKWAVTPSLSLSGWYANRRREGVRLPVNMGAFGTDLLWLKEFD